jgi:hypothetical protein
MTDKQPRRYGPVAWPASMLERVYKVIGRNDDTPVSAEIVERWVSNFKKLSGRFRANHKPLISRLK